MKVWSFCRKIMAVAGFFCVYSGVSTSDYYALELGQAGPASVGKAIIIGALLLMPSVIHLIITEAASARR